ncbi:hypothetical protein BGX23_001237 [Mortierella sp. AD031]|nr:hypothetical protein BGX23_001237 [Mortierella sp. AD031]
MENTAKNRFQPYARPSNAGRRQPAPVDRTNDITQNLPKAFVSFMKKSLSWLGITQPETDPELDKELNTTNGDFEFLPGADKDEKELAKEGGEGKKKEQETDEHEKLYPDLRDYITSISSKQGAERKYEDEDLAAAMTPERIAHRLKLRQELMDSTKGKAIEPSHAQKDETASGKASKEDIAQDEDEPMPTQSQAKSQQAQPPAESAEKTLDDLYKAGEPLSPAEINLVMRMRRLQQATVPTPSRPSNTHLLEEHLPSVTGPFIRPRQEFSASRQDRRPMDTTPIYIQEQPRYRSQLRHEYPDVNMSSQHPNDAVGYDRHGHSSSYSRSQHCECGREVRMEDTSIHHGKRPRAVRSPTPVSDNDSRQDYVQEQQEKPKKKRNVREIAGRFTALSSSDEEEDQRRYDSQVAERRAAARNGGSMDLTSSQSSQDRHAAPSFHNTPPQIYPTLQYGTRTKLYNPKIDEAMKWTSSAPSEPVVLDTWRCPKCDHRTKVTSSICKFCDAARPGPVVLNTTPISQLMAAAKEEFHDFTESNTLNHLASAAMSAAPAALGAMATAAFGVGAAKAISNWASSDSKDSDATKTTAEVPKAPALFSMPSVGPSTTPKEASKDKEAVKEVPQLNSWASIGFKGPDNTGKWKCTTCESYNKDELNKCGACETAKPGSKAPAAAAPSVPNMFAPVAAAPAAAPATTAATSAAAPPTNNWASIGFKGPDNTGKWKCTTCESYNKDELNKCGACETAKPGAKESSTAAPAVPNMFALAAASAASSSSSAIKPATAPVSFAFGTPSTSVSTSSEPTKAAIPPFSFGAPSSTASAPGSLFASPAAKPDATSSATAPAAAASPFSFAAPTSTSGSTITPKPATNLFGMPPASTSGDSKTTPTLFGASTSTATSSDSSKPAAISLSNPFAATPAASGAASLFGATSSAPSSTPAASKPAAPGFSFGAPSTSTAPTTPTTPMFGATPASTSTSLFGAKPAGTTSSPLFGAGSATTAATSAAAPLFGTGSVSAPGSTAASAPLFGGSTTTAAPVFGAPSASTPAFGATSTAPTSTPLFGGASTLSTSKPAASSPFGAAATTPLGSNLFGTPATTTIPTGAPAAASSPFTFGAKPTTSAPAAAASPFSFGATTPAPSTATPASSGFGGFGASSSTTSMTSTPGFSMTTPAAGASSTPSPFTFGSATTAPTATPSFGFGASTPAPATTPASGAGFGMGGFGSNATPSAAGASSSPFAFGNSSGTGAFAGFGQTAGAAPGSSNANMSMSMATPTPAAAGGFGGSATGGFGGFGSSATPGFGGASTTPAAGFGAQGTAGAQPSPFGGFGNQGGQSTFNSPMSGTGGFGSGSGMGGFGASTAPGGGGGFGGNITLAGSGFGGQSSAQGTPFGAAGGNNGAFGFQGMPTAPGGAQYTQPNPPAAGGFAFNMGVNTPLPAMPTDRKIAKMRTKKRT